MRGEAAAMEVKLCPGTIAGLRGALAEQPGQVVAGLSGRRAVRDSRRSRSSARHAARLCSRSNNRRRYLEGGLE